MICMKSDLPKTKIVTFIKQPGAEPTWNRPVFGVENAVEYADSYRMICRGDSGSGQFITNEDVYESSTSDGSRMILAAIVSRNDYKNDPFIDEHGNSHEIPCGTNYYDKKREKYLQNRAVSHSITWPKIHRWIKDQILPEERPPYITPRPKRKSSPAN